MANNLPYKAGITREQFLFNEMRITAKLLLEGNSDEEIIFKIYEDNLYQYPTNKMIKNLAKVCVSRLHTIDSIKLLEILANGSSIGAKQVCLYAMIKHYRIVYDFMVGVIGEKYRLKDMFYSKLDINVFFSSLQEQNADVAKWTEATIKKIKQVLTKILVDNEYLDSTKSTTLNPVLIDLEIKEIIKERNEVDILAAFNCFE